MFESTETVDLVFQQLTGVLLLGVGDQLRPVAVAGGCAAAAADPIAVADALEAHAPGTDLVELLQGLEPADLDDCVLVEAIAAWERVPPT